MPTGLWVWIGAVAVTLVFHPCPSLGGVQLHSIGPGLYIPGCCQVSKIGRPPETQHCPLQFLPPSIWLPFPPDSSPLPAPCFPLDTLHSCCHSALSQSQFIPSSWPYIDMHSPGRRGQTVTTAHTFKTPFAGTCRYLFGDLCLWTYFMCIMCIIHYTGVSFSIPAGNRQLWDPQTPSCSLCNYVYYWLMSGTPLK